MGRRMPGAIGFSPLAGIPGMDATTAPMMPASNNVMPVDTGIPSSPKFKMPMHRPTHLHTIVPKISVHNKRPTYRKR